MAAVAHFGSSVVSPAQGLPEPMSCACSHLNTKRSSAALTGLTDWDRLELSHSTAAAPGPKGRQLGDRSAPGRDMRLGLLFSLSVLWGLAVTTSSSSSSSSTSSSSSAKAGKRKVSYSVAGGSGGAGISVNMYSE
ncbi:hypothetical protein CRUP_022453 [Coryphaenoides rupestris]|nr:hypothetical protein CRUP_022453 [Coryphaenoides rupestris]